MQLESLATACMEAVLLSSVADSQKSAFSGLCELSMFLERYSSPGELRRGVRRREGASRFSLGFLSRSQVYEDYARRVRCKAEFV